MKDKGLLKSLLAYAFTSAIMLIGIIWSVMTVSPHKETTTPAITVEHQTHENASPIYVGFYLNSINAYKNNDKNFYADFYLWFHWEKHLGDSIDFEFMNSISKPSIEDETALDQYCSTIEYIPNKADEKHNIAWKTCADTHDEKNWHYRVYRVRGDFIYSLELQRYPFDEQSLGVKLELSQLLTNQAYFVADPNSNFPEDMDITGWLFKGALIKSEDVTYRTNFSLPGISNNDYSSYSRSSFSVNVARTPLPYVLKTLVPLLIIIFIGSLAQFLPPDIQGARLSLCASALLSTIALHLTVSSSLPNVGYSTIMDKCFINAYLHIGWLTVQSVIVGMLDSRQSTLHLKIDRASYIFFPITFLIGFLIAINN